MGWRGIEGVAGALGDWRGALGDWRRGIGGLAEGPLRQSGVPSSPRSRSAKERSGR